MTQDDGVTQLKKKCKMVGNKAWLERLERQEATDREIYLWEFMKRNDVSWAEMEYIGLQAQILGTKPTQLKMPNNELKEIVW